MELSGGRKILVVAILVVVLIILASYFVFTGKKESSNKTPSEQTQNRKPFAQISVDRRIVEVNEEVLFSANGSYDPDGDPLLYFWDFSDAEDSDGDGDPANDRDATGINVTHRYSSPGQYRVILTVSDGELSDEASTTITVLEGGGGGESPPEVTFLPPIYIEANPPIREQWKLTVQEVDREELYVNYTLQLYHNTTLLISINLGEATEGDVVYRDVDLSTTLSPGDIITIYPSEDLPVVEGDVVKLFYLDFQTPSAEVPLIAVSP